MGVAVEHPDKPFESCEYHHPKNGCILTTHKPAHCLFYFCQPEYLLEQYNISYSANSLGKFASKLFIGASQGYACNHIKTAIVEATEVVQRGEKSPEVINLSDFSRVR